MTAHEIAGRREAYIAALPASQRRTFAKAFAGECSARVAIRAKCLACCHGDRAAVRECTVILCPLHTFRPFTAR